MNALTVILSFAVLSFVALSLYLIQDFMKPLVIAAAVVVLLMLVLRR